MYCFFLGLRFKVMSYKLQVTSDKRYNHLIITSSNHFLSFKELYSPLGLIPGLPSGTGISNFSK